MLSDLPVLRYELLYEPHFNTVFIEKRYGIDCDRWAIATSGRDCLSKEPTPDGRYLFYLESMPSDRDDEYYQEFRFDTAEDAYAFWVDNRASIVATQMERLEYFSRRRQDGWGSQD